MKLDLYICNKNYFSWPLRIRSWNIGSWRVWLLLALGNFSPFVFAQTLAASSPANSALAAQHPAALAPSQAVTASAPPHKKFTYSISNYAEGRNDLMSDQIKIGFALTSIDLNTRNKNRAATLALISKTHDDFNFPLFKGKPFTPLTSAASWGEVEIVAALLAKGVDVNKVRSGGGQDEVPALISAVSGTAQAYQVNPLFPPAERFLETVKVLLKAGANPNATCCSGQTALSSALALDSHDPTGEKTKVAIIRALLDSGTDPGTAMPPLAGLSAESAAEITAMLLEHGLNPKAKGSTALATAVHNRRPDLVKLLLAKGADPNAPALYGGMGKRTVFADALVMGQNDIALALIKAGANPNVCSDEDANGKCMNYAPPLLFTALADAELFHAMVAKGVRLDTVDGQGQTALGYAISYQKSTISMVCVAGTTNCMKPPEDKFDRTAVTKMLLDAGADPNKRSGDESAPPDMLGADAAQRPRGTLPLLLADDSDHEIVTMLLDKGARLESLSVEGEQIGPISQAVASRRDFLARELLRRSSGKLRADEKWALYAAAAGGETELAEALVRHGVNPDERGPLGETALHYAVHRGNAAMVKRLLALGANPDAQTDTLPFAANTSSNPAALLMAKMQAYASHVQSKLKIYAAARQNPPNAQDGKVTPLMLAVISGDAEVAKALLNGGAKATLKSQQGFSARDIANSIGDREMAQLLAGGR